jgi:AcrR family transcriptional regulator
MPRGRPRQFDRDTALDRAVDLFWRRGYQDTSIAELTEHLGIASPSLYAAFGSKAALFCEAADRYQVTAGARPAIEMDAAATARDGIERLLRGNADLFTRPSGPRGCLLTRATLSCPAGDAAVRSYLERSRRQRLGQSRPGWPWAARPASACPPRVRARWPSTTTRWCRAWRSPPWRAPPGTDLHATADLALATWDAAAP